MGRIRKTDRNKLTPAKRAQIWTRYQDGYGYTVISRLEDPPYSTVRSIIERALKSGDTSFENKPRNGPSKKTSDRDDRALVRHAPQPPEIIVNLCHNSKTDGVRLVTKEVTL